MVKKFPNIRRFSWNSTKQEKWSTEVQKSASGRVRTMTSQLYPAWTITASYPAITDAEAAELLGFVALLKGSFEPFLWLDPEDNRAIGQTLAEVASGKYQAVIKMGEYVEPAEYIEDVAVYVGGVKQDASKYTVADGYITLKTPTSEVVKADYTYYWRVMLADDGLSITKKFLNVNTATIKMVVAR